jgi:hypothetical protein
MVEDFRSRMNKLLQEAEDMERVAREQQSQLEEMELLVRQRDEQLAEQQARVEELEIALKERDEESETLRSQLAEQEETLSKQKEEIDDLRSQLAQREASEQTLHEELSEREATETALREQLAEAETHVQEKAPEEEPTALLLDRFAGMEALFQQQHENLLFIQQELTRLHERFDHLGDRLADVPPPVVVEEVIEPEEEVEAVIELEEEVAAVIELEEVVAAVVEPEEVVAAVVEPEEVVAEARSPLQIPLYQVLEMVPSAAMVGLAGHDGLEVERIAQEGMAFESLELELADLAARARSVSGALESGPFLTLAFQFGEDFCMLSPVGEDHFAFILSPVESVDDFRRTQAVLLQAASQLTEFL